MSYHLLHLLSPGLRVRLKLDQLHIADAEKNVERTVPLADVAVIIAATPDLSLTAGALRRMAELNVLLLVCNEKFEPCCLTLPYYRATSTEALRRQVEWTPEWKESLWRQVITAKVRNQAAAVHDLARPHRLLSQIAHRCENPANDPSPSHKPLLSAITASRRAAFLSDSPSAHESRAARIYWRYLLPRLSEEEARREPGTRKGVNGMLDYGYAILRTAVLRSLAAHGFIAALGIHHAAKAGSFALADDLMEPLRPWIDRRLRHFLETNGPEMTPWIKEAAQVLVTEASPGKSKVRLLHAIDVYVRSFANASLARTNARLSIPMLS